VNNPGLFVGPRRDLDGKWRAAWLQNNASSCTPVITLRQHVWII